MGRGKKITRQLGPRCAVTLNVEQAMIHQIIATPLPECCRSTFLRLVGEARAGGDEGSTADKPTPSFCYQVVAPVVLKP